MIAVIRRRTEVSYPSPGEVIMRTYRSTGRPTGGNLGRPALKTAMLAFRAPVEQMLGFGLRRAKRRRPGDFERLGEHRAAVYLIAPAELPVAFRLEPMAGRVRVVRHTDGGACAARIFGSLVDLLDLFDGSLDADAAFFSRAVRVEGDTRAVVALHNALEAAELTLADIIGLPLGGHLVDGALRFLARTVRRAATGAV